MGDRDDPPASPADDRVDGEDRPTSPAGHFHGTADPRPEAGAFAGRRVGAYLLEREVGRGGTSVVYAGRRVEGAFERAVAVKVLARRATDADLRDRFEEEQRVLSGLDHPDIATIYEGGVMDEGYPYFVMELVEGVPLDRYCDAGRLTVEERVRIFLRVVEAVDHAHRSLVIHRDLKPSNILVTATGAVKLIDFGIARILRVGVPPADDATTLTTARWMTPEYGAPEQFRGERSTTATDVYQLGIILYELLTGRNPVSAISAGSFYLTARAVCETEPRRPSSAVTGPLLQRGGGREGENGGGGAEGSAVLAPSDIARARGTEVGPLRNRLRGDLDAIVLRAIQKDPALRYGSAEALARDLRRHLDGRPVEAREGTLLYRASRFVTRHRGPVAAAVAALLLLVGGGALHTAQMAGQRDIARKEAARATTVTAFLLDLFEASHPEEVRGEPLTAAFLLERGVKRAQELTDQPVVQAEVLATIARAYHGLADYDRSDALYTRSLELRRAHLGPGHPEVAHALAHLGWTRLVRNDFPAAARLFREAAGIQRATLGPDHPEVANSLHGLGLALNGLGRLAPAIELLEQAQAIRRTAYGATAHPEIANGLNDMAILLREQNDLDHAQRLLVEALGMRRSILPANHPDIGKGAHHLASLLHERGRYAEAEPLYLEALESWRHSLGPDHPFTLSTVRALTALYRESERPDEADRYAALLDGT